MRLQGRNSMSRRLRIGRIAALAAITAALLLPASNAVGKAPVAHKSGALINYVTTAKLKIRKRINIFAVCTANCSVNTTTTIKGRGYKQTFPLNGTLQAGVPGGPFFKPNGPLLDAMTAQPGSFKIISSMTATDLVTGATDSIAHTFKLKR
jgi:hypothetical protein